MYVFPYFQVGTSVPPRLLNRKQEIQEFKRTCENRRRRDGGVDFYITTNLERILGSSPSLLCRRHYRVLEDKCLGYDSLVSFHTSNSASNQDAEMTPAPSMKSDRFTDLAEIGQQVS